MINYSTSKLIHPYKIMDILENRNQNRMPLLGKAVLLIGNDTAVLSNLVMQLAEKGADIAVLCWKIPLETVRWLKDQVQSLGRRLFIIEQAQNQDSSVDQLVHRITTEWGEFDIFIDVSARRNKPAASEHLSNGQQKKPDQETRRRNPVWRPEQWHLTQVVLKKMTSD